MSIPWVTPPVSEMWLLDVLWCGASLWVSVARRRIGLILSAGIWTIKESCAPPSRPTYRMSNLSTTARIPHWAAAAGAVEVRHKVIYNTPQYLRWRCVRSQKEHYP